MNVFVLTALVSTVSSVSMFEEGQPSARLVEIEQMSLGELHNERSRLRSLRPTTVPGIVMLPLGGVTAGVGFLGAAIGFVTAGVVVLVVGGAIAIAGLVYLLVAGEIRKDLTADLRAVEQRIDDHRHAPGLSAPPLLQSSVFTF